MDTKGIQKFAVAVLVVVLLTGGAIQVRPALSQSIAASSTTGGRIAFVSSRDGNAEIYVMNADGSGVTRLTYNSVWDWCPSWRPDGGAIAYSFYIGGNWEIFTMNADGSGQTRLTNNSTDDYGPAWSPDGSKIAFCDGKSGLSVMNADGTEVTRLTDNTAGRYSPSWSPDGKKIAFIFRVSEGVGEIYVMNADGSSQTRLSNLPVVGSIPSWSPDGTKIAFVSWRDGNGEIYVMNTNDTGLTRLTDNTVTDTDPSWSPDGSQIVFTSGDDGEGNAEIYVMNADGSGQTRLTSNSVFDGRPVWEPTLRAWTLMFYMVGDNDAGMELALSREFKALGEASHNPNVHIAIFWDGINSDASYRVFSGGVEVKRVSLGELSTGSPDTLANFVKWASEECPAQHYALIIDDHGQGLGGAAVDNHPVYKDWLGPKELRQALSETGRVDIIYMSACLMGNLESAYQLRGYADYYVAYESQGWGPRDFYSMVASVSDSTTAEQLALSMAETYFSGTQRPTAVSVVRLSEVENVVAKTSALAGALRRHFLDIDQMLWNLTDASVLQRFDENSPANGIDNDDMLADLYHFAWLVESGCPEQDIKTAAQELMSALGSYVVRSWQRSGSVSVKGSSYDWSHENAHGVSIACLRGMACFYTYDLARFRSRHPLATTMSKG